MISRFYSVLQHLSIDIVIGAVILLRFFCVQLGIEIDLPVYFLLASAVWLIYTMDHLRDTKRAKRPKRARYLFHEQYESVLKIAMSIIIFLCIICVFMVPMMILFAGCALAAFSLFYLSIQDRLSKLGLKELYVSIIYTSGILLAPFVLGNQFDSIIFILLLLATFLNLILFSWFEQAEDRKDRFSSIATKWKPEKLEKLILLLISIGMAVAIVNFNLISLYFLIVFVIFSMMVLRREGLSKSGIYRTVGDGVFILPVLFELW
jgi:hypothetical protein